MKTTSYVLQVVRCKDDTGNFVWEVYKRVSAASRRQAKQLLMPLGHEPHCQWRILKEKVK